MYLISKTKPQSAKKTNQNQEGRTADIFNTGLQKLERAASREWAWATAASRPPHFLLITFHVELCRASSTVDPLSSTLGLSKSRVEVLVVSGVSVVLLLVHTGNNRQKQVMGLHMASNHEVSMRRNAYYMLNDYINEYAKFTSCPTGIDDSREETLNFTKMAIAQQPKNKISI